MKSKSLKYLIIILVFLVVLIGLLIGILIYKSNLLSNNSNNNTVENKIENTTINQKNNNDKNENAADTLDNIKNAASDNFYYQFEEKGKKYILFGYKFSSYIDMDNSKIKTKHSYKDNNLYIDLNTSIVQKDYNTLYNMGVMVDDYSLNMYFDTIEIKKDFSEVYINVTDSYPNSSSNDQAKLEPFEGGIFYSKEGKGYINSNGKIIVPAKYQYLYEQEGFYNVCTKSENPVNGGQYGLYDSEGNLVIECQYDDMQVLDKNSVKVCKDGKTALIDTKGNLISNWVDGKADVFKNNLNYTFYKTASDKYGVVDKKMNVIIPAQFDRIRIISNDYIQVSVYTDQTKKKEKIGVVDIKGNIIVPMEIEKDTYPKVEIVEQDGKLSYLLEGKTTVVYNINK